MALLIVGLKSRKSKPAHDNWSEVTRSLGEHWRHASVISGKFRVPVPQTTQVTLILSCFAWIQAGSLDLIRFGWPTGEHALFSASLDCASAARSANKKKKKHLHVAKTVQVPSANRRLGRRSAKDRILSKTVQLPIKKVTVAEPSSR
jgi:hypothetical protein